MDFDDISDAYREQRAIRAENGDLWEGEPEDEVTRLTRIERMVEQRRRDADEGIFWDDDF